jgi:hypothetical protein
VQSGVSAILAPMNSIKQITSGLASSLFLAAGLTRLAEKTDPMQKQVGKTAALKQPGISSEDCVFPCTFTPQTGQ